MPQPPPPAAAIYHICRRVDWEAARAQGRYLGSRDDLRDGFLHFSAAAQVEESCAKHRAGEPDLVLLVVDPTMLGTALKWEPSRGGALFPHLYGVLPLDAVRAVFPLPLDGSGRHRFPPLG